MQLSVNTKKLRLQVPGKVLRESGPSIAGKADPSWHNVPSLIVTCLCAKCRDYCLPNLVFHFEHPSTLSRFCFLKLTWKVIYRWKRQPYFFLRTYFKNRVLARCMLWLISFARANPDCKERKLRITKWKILAHIGTRTQDPWFSSLVPYPSRHAVWYTKDNLKLIQ